MAVEDGLLRLCEAENSVLSPLGKDLRPVHPLLGRRAHNDKNESSSSTACRSIILEKMHKQFVPPLWPNSFTLA